MPLMLSVAIGCSPCRIWQKAALRTTGITTSLDMCQYVPTCQADAHWQDQVSQANVAWRCAHHHFLHKKGLCRRYTAASICRMLVTGSGRIWQPWLQHQKASCDVAQSTRWAHQHFAIEIAPYSYHHLMCVSANALQI